MGNTIVKDVEIPEEFLAAEHTSYDNSNSKLTSTNVNAAIDELDKKIDQSIADLIGSADSTMDTLGEIQKAMEEGSGVVEALDAAIGSKAKQEDLVAHTTNKNNPHGVTFSQLSDKPTKLSQFENDLPESDAVSFTQSLTAGTQIGTLNINGEDIPLFAPAPEGGGSDVSFTQGLTTGTVVGKLTINGTEVTLYAPTNTDTTYGVVSATASGLCPVLPNDSTKYLRGDGAWAVPPDNNTTYNAATQSAAGLMSAADKTKLDGIQASADAVSVSASLASGTQIGTLTINGTATKLYAPTPVTAAATTSAAGLMSAADKTKLDAITASADSVTFAQSLTAGTQIGTITINGTAIKLYAPTASTLTSLGITATATELNYMDGVTSNVQTQLNTIRNSANMTNPTMTIGTSAPSNSMGKDGDVYLQIIE